MKNGWVKFGCFLIGYNYSILQNCSEVSAKAVKRYTAAMLIIAILWACIGFTFTQRYLKGGTLGSAIGAIVMVLIIIQVERQIILAVHKSKWLAVSRIFIAVVMAAVGSLIIDQIIFKDDIEHKRMTMLEDEVNELFPKRAYQLKLQIVELDSIILDKEAERKQLTDELGKNPFVKSYSTSTTSVPFQLTTTDSLKGTVNQTLMKTATSYNTTSVPNPKAALLPSLEKHMSDLRAQKNQKDNDLLSLKNNLSLEIKEKVGFLDELKVMASMLSESSLVLGVWLLWILFLFSLELLVLIGKMLEKENDYDYMIKHQMNIHMRKIQLLAESRTM